MTEAHPVAIVLAVSGTEPALRRCRVEGLMSSPAQDGGVHHVDIYILSVRHTSTRFLKFLHHWMSMVLACTVNGRPW